MQILFKNGLQIFDKIENEDYIKENKCDTIKDDEDLELNIEEEESDEEDDNLSLNKKNSDSYGSEPPGEDEISLNKEKEINY